jgi:hypothetical protein
LRRDLEDVVDALMAESETSHDVTLDAIGDAIGTRAVSTDDVDAIMVALETRGRRIVGPEGGGGEERLRVVVTTARALVGELGRRPTVSEIAARAQMEERDVRHALFLSKVMQR